MQLSSVDLNLLVVLDTLLEESSVTRTAQRLNLSVPATSRALGRLRRAFQDPLLVRSGRGLQLTATAVDLKPQLRGLLEQAEQLLDRESRPLTRSLTVLAPQDLILTRGVALLAELAEAAPAAEVRFLATDGGRDGADAVRDGTVDLAIMVNASKHADLRDEGLARAELTAVVRAGHGLARGTMTSERFAAATHVLVSRSGRTGDEVDRALREAGQPRTVRCVVPNYIASLHLTSSTDLVSIAPVDLVRELRESLGLMPITAPIPLRPLRVNQLWHPRRDQDPSVRLLRTSLSKLAGEFIGQGSTPPH
ncbi:LysR family transcriptional regulator [Nocardia sp. NPDC051030]|uniref:LysR family transcriptional regulator n=1 Tax=Nocardia sp. NPDC051030 TaxID=3155162 RepID=UPI0034293690